MGDFQADVPIYLQVVNKLKFKIMNGTLQPGDKIASVRELALELGVNPNTVQRAFAELEREGFIRTERAVGRYVADNQKLIDDCKNQLVKEDVHQFVERMKMLGISKADIIRYLDEEE